MPNGPRRPEEPAPVTPLPQEELVETVAEKEGRKLRARAQSDRGLARGLGVFGMVGWSVAVPTLLGIALGVSLDRRGDGRYSWTLMLMIAGLAVGCFNAWYWVRKEAERDG